MLDFVQDALVLGHRRRQRRGLGRLDFLQLLGDSDIFPAQAGAEEKGRDGEADAEVHDVADGHGVALERRGEPVALQELPDRGGAGVDDNIGVHADLAHVLLELVVQAIVEDCVGGHEPGGGAHVLAEQHDGHGDGDLGCGDEILDGDVGLNDREDKVSEKEHRLRPVLWTPGHERHVSGWTAENKTHSHVHEGGS